jgi:tetratricopeptide (TPR) repeat protein
MGTACAASAPPVTTPNAEGPAAAAEPPIGAALTEVARGAVLLPDLGTHHRAVTTGSPEAQAYFDQGLRLTYGFNHDEAARSFARGAEIDPNCAMCYWGVAYTLGPNYNVPMLPHRAKAAWEAVTRGQAAAGRSSMPVEKAMMAALAKRYKGPEYVDPAAMGAFHQAYADAMREVAHQFPDDDDVQTLFAEALMNVNPWKLWTLDGRPTDGTVEIVTTLEDVLSRAPTHPGANHYYIHAVEASKNPARALAAADRLGGLMPGAGHLVHMPAHIYQRVGKYGHASEANRRAIVADEAYLAKVTPPGYYPFYLSHNHGFLAYSTSMEGKSQESLAAAAKSAGTMPKDVVCGMPGMDFFLSEPLLVMVRFARWDEILAAPKPDTKYAALTALWHHARGMTLAAKSQPAEARAELAEIQRIGKEVPAELITGLNEGKAVLDVAAKVLEARIAEAEKSPDAIKLWEVAVVAEDQLAYNEPADWFYPVRHFLGAALLDAKRAKEAEKVYRADLLRNPGNGWGLFGLWKALEAQKKKKDAAAVEGEFQRAWAGADIVLSRSAY